TAMSASIKLASGRNKPRQWPKKGRRPKSVLRSQELAIRNQPAEVFAAAQSAILSMTECRSPGAGMSRLARSAGCILAGLLAAAPAALAREARPDFSSTLAGWAGLRGGGPFYEPVPGALPPVTSDPAHPFVPNGVKAQPTFRIADLSNPNLKPWVKERMRQDI